MNAPDEDLYPLEQIRQTVESVPHFRELGITLVELARGTCTAKIDVSPRLAGNPDTGTVHGGVIATLLDSIGSLAAFGRVRRGQSMATLDLRIDYLSAADPGRTIYARAECYRLTRSVAFVRGTAYCEENEPLAHCAATFMVGSVGLSLT